MSEVKVQIIIKGQGQEQQLQFELDSSTLIQEIFDFIQETFNFTVPTSQWTCFSKARNSYFKDNSQVIGNSFKEETLEINTSADARLAITNIQNAFQGSVLQQPYHQFSQQVQQNQQPQQPPPQQNQFVQQQNPDQNMSDRLILTINVIDGKHKTKYKCAFSQQDTLNDVAIATQNYCGISLDAAAIDLFLFGQAYNNQLKRKQTLGQLLLKQDTTIEARVRWSGGLK